MNYLNLVGFLKLSINMCTMLKSFSESAEENQNGAGRGEALGENYKSGYPACALIPGQGTYPRSLCQVEWMELTSERLLWENCAGLRFLNDWPLMRHIGLPRPSGAKALSRFSFQNKAGNSVWFCYLCLWFHIICWGKANLSKRKTPWQYWAQAEDLRGAKAKHRGDWFIQNSL